MRAFWQDADFTLMEENVSLSCCSPAVPCCKRNNRSISEEQAKRTYISFLMFCKPEMYKA